VHLKDKEIEVLVAPSFFGHECVIGKDIEQNSVATGSVVADTSLCCLVVHKKLIQQFAISVDFVNNVARRSTQHPNDIQLEMAISGEKTWGKFKEVQMLDIKKSKWNFGKFATLKELPGGKSVVVTSMERELY